MTNRKGPVFALLAAFCNAWVGIITLRIFQYNVSPDSAAFYKCVAAFACLSFYLLFNAKARSDVLNLIPHFRKIALLSLFGVFILYFFETAAYRYSHVAIATFTLLGTSTITTFLGNHFLLHAKLTYRDVVAIMLSITGLVWFYLGAHDHFHFSKGLVLAAIAGIGYGLFLVSHKKTKIPYSGIPMLWWMLGLGSLYLLIPYFFTHPVFPPLQSWPSIMILGLIPTIGGFYFTTKALSLVSSMQVQLCELAEPILASVLAMVFFHQWLNGFEIVGAIFILLSLFMVIQTSRKSVAEVESPLRADYTLSR